MNITVKTLVGKNIDIEIEKEDTVNTLKLKIQDVECIHPSRQRLIFDNQQLYDEYTLEDYNIRNRNIVYLIITRNCEYSVCFVAFML